MSGADELVVMATIRDALALLPDDAARVRVLRWSFDVVGGTEPSGVARAAAPGTGESITDLLDAVQPETRAERILTVAFWLETSTGVPDFSSQSVNDELKNLGDGVPNITDAISGLINRKPSLVRQVRKTGRAQQARKRYALTAAGRAVVTDLIARRHSGEGG
jgi:hypothetical protein